jgi:hypothetical protein
MSTPSDPLAERGRFLRQTYRELVDLIQLFEAGSRGSGYVSSAGPRSTP